MRRNKLGLAIAIALTTLAHEVTGVRQHLIKDELLNKPKTVREPAFNDESFSPHSGFREQLRRSNPEKYRELLDAERQDRGITNAQHNPEV